MNKRKIIPSLVLNSIIVVLAICGIIVGVTIDKFSGEIFKYFTFDSNMLMLIASAIYIVYLGLLLAKNIVNMPKWVEMFKLASTVSVVITLLTVIFFLTPTIHDPIILYTNSSSLFHVAIPALSLTTWMLFEHSLNKYKLPESLYGIIPMVVYSIFYIAYALSHIDNGKVPSQYDWYGFCQFGLNWIPLVIVIMYGFAFLISWTLWLANTKIDIKYQSWTRSQYKRFWAIFINGLIFILFFIAIMIRLCHEQMDYTTFKYFTTQSNVLMGLMAIVYMTFQIVQFKDKEINKTASLINLFCTTYVSITFIVTVLMLTPGAAVLKLNGWPVSRLYVNSNILFHVFIPLLSLANWIIFEHTDRIEFRCIFYSFIYVAFYGIFYIAIAYSHMDINGNIPMKYDWYKFCSFGPIILGLIMLIIFGFDFLFVWLFRKGNKNVNILKDVQRSKKRNIQVKRASKH